VSNTWFRMYHEFANDPKIQMMSEVFQRRFIMVLCLRCSNDDVTLQDEEIAFQLRVSNDEWAETKAEFIKLKLINSDNKPKSWDKRQFVSDSSAARVALHRDKKKKGKKQECNVTVTPPDTDTDTDTYLKDNNNLTVICGNSPESPPNENLPDNLIKLESESEKPKRQIVPYQKITDLYHEVLPELSKVIDLGSKRKGYISARWRSGQLPNLDTWKAYFEYVRQSEFLLGHSDPGPNNKHFKCDLEWITKESNYHKITECKYHDPKGVKRHG